MIRIKWIKPLLFPPMAVLILLLPAATAFLVYAMVALGTESPIAIASYVLAAYTLTVWCLRIPRLIRAFKTFRDENRFARRWREDERLRINTSLYSSLGWNILYALFQLWLGVYHHTFWFYSLAGYHASLALMRFFLVRYTRVRKPGENRREELKKYRACGLVLLVMNLALALIVFFMVYWNRTFHHHEITTIMMATYTFTAFITAIISLVRYRKHPSPVYSASKTVSLAAACVSMLTLESTMLTTFGQNESPLFRRIMLAATGFAVSLFVVAMAIRMIVKAGRGLKELNTRPAKENYHGQ